jgi:hypothetical protein
MCLNQLPLEDMDGLTVKSEFSFVFASEGEDKETREFKRASVTRSENPVDAGDRLAKLYESYEWEREANLSCSRVVCQNTVVKPRPWWRVW